jgi:excisionase family DNA binding protein
MLTVKQVARAIGVSDQTVRREVERGELPAVRVGAAIRIPRQMVIDKYQIPDDYDFGPA